MIAPFYCDMIKFREMSDFNKCEEGGAQVEAVDSSSIIRLGRRGGEKINKSQCA